MKNIILFIAILSFPLLASAQSANKIAKKGITKRTTTETIYEDGLDKEVVEEERWFDERGNLVEHKEYSSEGKLKFWAKYTYSEKDNLLSESFYDVKERLTEKVEYVYKDGLRAEKLYYDGKERLIKKKVYAYEYK